jgi:hypothetical protein
MAGGTEIGSAEPELQQQRSAFVFDGRKEYIKVYSVKPLQSGHSNWDCLTLAVTACINSGCPLVLLTDSTLPSERIEILIITSSEIPAILAITGYSGGTSFFTTTWGAESV